MLQFSLFDRITTTRCYFADQGLLFLNIMKTFLYFAYGSNMLSRRLCQRTPSAIAVTTGYVEGRRLAFHKVGRDGSGKCDIKATDVKSDKVFGVLYRISQADKDALDKAEDAGNSYEEEHVNVQQKDGTSCTATAYVAIKIAPELRPFTWYKNIVVAGAVEHGLPDAYIEKIRLFPSQPDPDSGRCAQYEQLLNRN